MAGQVGTKTETVWGTPVTVDAFVPVLSSTFTIDEGRMTPAGIKAGRFTKQPAVFGARKVSGKVELELPNITIAPLLKHCFGLLVSTTGSGPYVHTLTAGTHLTKSFTLQTGVEDASTTVRPFTAEGVKIGSWQLSCKVAEFAKLSYDWTAEDIVTATGLASASYAATLVPFTFVQGTVSVNGAAVASANGVTLSATKGLADSRWVLGTRLIREQLTPSRFDFMSEITADFDGLTLFALGVAGTQVASVLTFTNGTDSLVITTSGQVTGDPPSLASNGLEGQTIRVQHSHATADASAITAVLTNSDVLAT